MKIKHKCIATNKNICFTNWKITQITTGFSQKIALVDLEDARGLDTSDSPLLT